MRIAIIDIDTSIVDLVLVDDSVPDTLADSHFGIVSETANVGDSYKNGSFNEKIIIPTVPQSISDRQFFQQLAIVGIITEDEALASNAGVIPAEIMAIIDTMPAEAQFSAKMIVSGATVYNRTDPLTIGIGSAYGWTAEQIDGFFIAASAL